MIGDVCRYHDDNKNLDYHIAAFNAAFGQEDSDVVQYIIQNIGNIVSGPEQHEILTTFTTIIAEMKPKDHMERLMLCQMLMANHLAMQSIAKSIKSMSIDEQKENMAIATRMMRLYNQQFEVLRRYRSVGNQIITVNHNHINANNAIVNNVQQ